LVQAKTLTDDEARRVARGTAAARGDARRTRLENVMDQDKWLGDAVQADLRLRQESLTARNACEAKIATPSTAEPPAAKPVPSPQAAGRLGLAGLKAAARERRERLAG
jgi:hypothetical protein